MFNLFNFKRKVGKTPLLEGSVGFHTYHLSLCVGRVPSTDQSGCRQCDFSFAVLCTWYENDQFYKEQGIKSILTIFDLYQSCIYISFILDSCCIFASDQMQMCGMRLEMLSC